MSAEARKAGSRRPPTKPGEKRETTPMVRDYHLGDPNVKSMTHREPVCHFTNLNGQKVAVLGKFIYMVQELPQKATLLTLQTGAELVVEESYPSVLNLWSIALSRM